MSRMEASAQPQTKPGPSVLSARTTLVEPTDPFAYLARHEGAPRFLHWTSRATLVGVGRCVELVAQGPQRFDEVGRAARTWTERLAHERGPGVPESVGPRWMGGFAYNPGGHDADWPDARFVLPHRQLVLEDGRAYETLIGDAPPVVQPPPRTPTPPVPVVWRNDPNFEPWATAVRQALDAVRNQVVEKVVLARRLHATLAAPPRLPRLLRALATRTPAGRVFLVEPRPDVAFLGASPELLLERRAGRVRTLALAGSRNRGRTDAEDETLARALVASSKDAWEHEIVSRFLRARLNERGLPWTSPVERGVLRLPNVQHLETRFEAAADPGESLLDLAARLHPTPAVGGWPPEAAQRLLERLESSPRGWYAGAIGWFDAEGDGELTVGIRSANVQGRDVVLHAGCGIVEGSDPAEEWAESRAKFQLLADAFEAEAA